MSGLVPELVSELNSPLVTSLLRKAFIFSVKTDNAGTSTSTQFTVPTVSGGTYDCTVYWGDGSTESITTWDDAGWTHEYGVAGTYVIKIIGTFIQWRFNNGGDDTKMISISQWGNFDLAGISGGAFFGCSNMTNITALDIPKFLSTSTANELTGIFYNCNALTNISNVELWECTTTGLRTNMFLNCNNFNQDISNLISSNVTNITNMIRNTAMDQDLSSSDFSGVTSAISFADGTTMSTANYDALLNSLDSQSLNNSVSIGFGSATYTGLSDAGVAHTKLVNELSWTITDGGAVLDADVSLWIDAYDEATITESSGAVSQWDDKSPTGDNLTQGTASVQPTTGTSTINSKNVVLFDEDFMGLPASFDANGKTLFFVVDLDDSVTDSNANNKGIIANSGVSNYNNHITLGLHSGSSWYDIFLENNAGWVYQKYIPNMDNAAMKAPIIMTIVLDSASYKLRMNQNEYTNNTAVGTTNFRYVGKGYGSYSGSGNILKGAIGEIIRFDRALSTEDIESVEDYLNAKWSTY